MGAWPTGGNFSNKIVFSDEAHFISFRIWEFSSNWTEVITSRKSHCLVRSLVRRCDWTLLLRKQPWNDCHRQFGALSSFDNRPFLTCYWRIRLGEHVVSTRRWHMPYNSGEYGFIARDKSWPHNFSSWWYQLAINHHHHHHAIWHL